MLLLIGESQQQQSSARQNEELSDDPEGSLFSPGQKLQAHDNEIWYAMHRTPKAMVRR